MPPEFNQAPIETPKNHTKIWFLIGLGILLVFINGWMLYQNYFAEKAPAQNLTTTDPIDEFTDWKTYRNEEYGFEFKYPKEWIQNDYGDGSYFTKPPKISVLQIDFINEQKAREDIVEDTCPENHVIEIGVKTFYVVYCSASSEDYVYLVNLKSGKVLKFSYHDNFETDWSENKKVELLSQIISTFKFISTSTTLDTSNWKIYRNEEYGFEIKFNDKWVNYYDITFKTPDFDYILFCLPTAEENISVACPSEDPGFVGLFSIEIYTKKQWGAQEIEHQNPSRILGKKNDLVFAYNKSQDPPDDLIPAYIETKEILSTFKFIE